MEDKSKDGLEFKAAEPADFNDGKITLYPQVLDNQWVPVPIMEDMHRQGHRRIDRLDEINREARHEYVSALLSGNRVVVNRAFFANSAVVTRDYHNSHSRDALCQLLNQGVVIPYLYNEDTPVVRLDFDHDQAAAHTWREQILGSSKPTLLRMSWDDQDNDAKIRHNLARGFSNLVTGMAGLNWAAVHDALSMPKDADTRTAFRKRRLELASFALSNVGEDHQGRETYVSRNNIYKHFICRDGSDVSQGIYDYQKPFAAQIKQLVDLAYGVGVPDNVNGQLITPANSPNRSALQELSMPGNSFLHHDQIDALLSKIAVDEILNAIAGQVDMFDFSALQLPDVLSGRSTDEWIAYNQALQKVAAANYLGANGPDQFNALLHETAGTYRQMLLALRQSAVDRKTAELAPLVVETGGLAVSIIAQVSGMEWWEFKLDPNGESQLKHMALNQLESLGTGKKQVCLSLAFWNQNARRLGRAKIMKVDFCTKKMEVAKDTFAAFLKQAQEKAILLTGNELKLEVDLKGLPSTGIAAKEAEPA